MLQIYTESKGYSIRGTNGELAELIQLLAIFIAGMEDGTSPTETVGEIGKTEIKIRPANKGFSGR